MQGKSVSSSVLKNKYTCETFQVFCKVGRTCSYLLAHYKCTSSVFCLEKANVYTRITSQVCPTVSTLANFSGWVCFLPLLFTKMLAERTDHSWMAAASSRSWVHPTWSLLGREFEVARQVSFPSPPGEARKGMESVIQGMDEVGRGAPDFCRHIRLWHIERLLGKSLGARVSAPVYLAMHATAAGDSSTVLSCARLSWFPR